MQETFGTVLHCFLGTLPHSCRSTSLHCSLRQDRMRCALATSGRRRTGTGLAETKGRTKGRTNRNCWE